MTIKEYWNLIGREPFLAITWEPDFSQACSFCRILMNHKNFHFSQIPGKTNDVIFLKSSKTLFLGHFLPFLVIFCPMGIFSKKSDSVTNNYIWNPKTIVSFRKNCANPEKTYEQTEGRTDGRTLFYRTLAADAGGPKSYAMKYHKFVHWKHSKVLLHLKKSISSRSSVFVTNSLCPFYPILCSVCKDQQRKGLINQFFCLGAITTIKVKESWPPIKTLHEND